MKIADVDFDEFISWMGYLEENIDESEEILTEAVECVPAIFRLMMIYNNAVEDNADDIMLMRNRDIVNVLISLYQLEKGRSVPSISSPEKKSRTKKRSKK